MKLSSRRISICAATALAMALALVGCSNKDDQATSNKKPSAPHDQSATTTPPVPPMPAEWKVVEDIVSSPADLIPIAKSLGADVAALRNTTYVVDGKRIKVNTIVAADKANADTIEAKINTMKPPEFSLRKGNRIFEFVCNDAAIPQMRAGRAHLDK